MADAAWQAPDPTIYPEEDDVGEHEIQTYILEVLRPLVERYLKERAVVAHVGSDQFIYWRRHEPTRSVAPDLYVLPGVSQSIAIGVWKVWEHGGVVPSFVLEVVGGDREKDYTETPKSYAELGVAELVIFDPFPGRHRVAFQVYRRERGSFVRLEESNGDRIRSLELGCFIRVVGSGDEARLRLGLGAKGDELFPTGEEAALAEKEAALAATEAALARVAELEAKLAR